MKKQEMILNVKLVFALLQLGILLLLLLLCYGTSKTRLVWVTDTQQTLVPRDQLEDARRQVASGIRNTRTFLRYHLAQLARASHPKVPEMSSQIKRLLAEAEDRLRVSELDLTSIDHLADLTAWREREASALRQEAQRRIDALQNPPDCAAAKKLVCTVYRKTGFGSVLHHLVYCFMAAYGSGRTFLLASRGWKYSPEGWEKVFQPLSRTCTQFPSELVNWPGKNDSNAVLYPESDRASPMSLHQPMTVPFDIADRLSKFHEVPGVWWLSQFLAYLLRAQPEMKKMFERVKEELNYSNPIVGVHVRRTDKISETSYYPMEEYMKHVEDYYLSLDLASPSSPPVPRRVFLATELSSVVTEAKTKFPHYEFLWHKNSAEKLYERYNLPGLMDLVTDLYLLTHSDYVVCTFTSNICLLTHEWMQFYRPDAAFRVFSLDDNHYFGFWRQRFVRVRFPHHPDQLGEKQGFTHGEMGQTFLTVFGRPDGYKQVHVREGNKTVQRMLPDYKVQDVVDVVNVTLSQDILDRN